MSHIYRIPAAALCLAFALAPAAADAQCDPDTFTTDLSGFSHLPTEDFESTGYALNTQFGNCFSCTDPGPMMLPGFNIYSDATVGGSVEYLPTCGQAIPVHSNFVGILVGNMVIEPTMAIDEIAFDFGVQFGAPLITVETSDGMSRSFTVPVTPTSNCSGFGFNGAFGYCTGDPSVSIVRITAGISDGGIDNIRCLNCVGPVSVEDTSWGRIKAGYPGR